MACALGSRFFSFQHITYCPYALRCVQVRTLLEQWVNKLCKSKGLPVRLGHGTAAATLFSSQAPTVRRAGAGALPIHRDFNPADWSDNMCFSIIVLLENIRDTADGPTFVYPCSRHCTINPKCAVRSLRAKGYERVELLGCAGDAFIFHAADYHGVAPIQESREGGGATARRVRSNLVLGAWSKAFDHAFKVE